MEIQINPKLIEILEELAQGQQTTPEEYASNYIEGHLTSVLKNKASQLIISQSVDDIIDSRDAILDKMKKRIKKDK